MVFRFQLHHESPGGLCNVSQEGGICISVNYYTVGRRWSWL